MAIVKEMTGRNRAAKLEIVKQMSNVQVQPVENKGRIVSVSHLIVSECYLPVAGPVVRTGPHLEAVSAFGNTGLKSRMTNGRLVVICFPIHFTHSFMHPFTQF